MFSDNERIIREISNTDYVYRGEIKNNKFDGFGEIYTSDYDYYGEFREGYMHGEGVCHFKKEKSKYDGFFNKSLKHGFGKVTLSDGTIIEGNFYNDKLNKAVIRYKSKEVLECSFVNGLINGIGKSIYPNGYIIEKEYKNSKTNNKEIFVLLCTDRFFKNKC